MIQLVIPSIQYNKSFLECLDELNLENCLFEFDEKKIKEDFSWFVNTLFECSDQSKVSKYGKNWVPFTTYWLVKKDQFIGQIFFRHRLHSKWSSDVLGHIGGCIMAKERGKGHGKLLLKLGLERIKPLGLQKFMATCDKSNIASQKIILANGGVFESEYSEGLDEPMLKYQIGS